MVGVLDERLRKCAGRVITCFGCESQSQSERGLLLGGGEEIRGKQSAGEAHSSASVMSFTRNISKLKLGRKTNHSSGFNGSRSPRLPIEVLFLKLVGDAGFLALSQLSAASGRFASFRVRSARIYTPPSARTFKSSRNRPVEPLRGGFPSKMCEENGAVEPPTP